MKAVSGSEKLEVLARVWSSWGRWDCLRGQVKEGSHVPEPHFDVPLQSVCWHLSREVA